MTILANIAIFLTLLTIAQSCETTYNLGYSECTLRVNYIDSTCTDFNFDHCSWTECVQWSYSTITNTTYCSLYHTFSDSSWSGCTHRCCDSSVVYNQTADAIKSCQDYLDGKFKLYLTIILSIVFGLLFIILMWWLICKTSCCSSLG